MRLIIVVLAWLAVARAPGAEPSLSLLTWNVLGDQANAVDRVPALLRTIADLDADIVALQEVEPWMRAQIEQAPALRHYRGTVVDGKVMAPGGLYLLSRLDVRSIQIEVIPSHLDRCALIAEIEIAQQQSLTVGIVHLEGLRDAAEVRALQLHAVQRRLARAGQAILLGDFNFGDGEPETAALDPAWTDCWRALKATDPGWTWDNERNPLARAHALQDEPSRRLDRVLVRSEHWKPVDCRIVGDMPTSLDKPDVFPSDHFGVYVRMVATGR